MNHCPSHDWDRYLDAIDVPDECPQCGKDNGDPETGEVLSEQFDPFCSEECSKKYSHKSNQVCTVENCSNTAAYYILDSSPLELLCSDCHESIMFRGTSLQIEPIE